MATMKWTDQPEVILKAEQIFHSYHDCRTVVGYRIRKVDGDEWYISTGNLFGSQTISCDSIESYLVALELAVNAKKEATLPKGCVIIAEPQQEAVN
jgi:hypothetical protein